MDNIELVKVALDDVNQLQSICRQTFYETYADGNTKENMQKYLDEVFTLDNLIAELTNPDTEIYYAIHDLKVIGYIKINRGEAQTDLKGQNSLEIERIYVLKEFQGNRVGQILFDQAREIAISKKADYLWLGVWEKNPKAMHFYKRNGLIEFDKHIFKLGDDMQTDIMMKLPLHG
jgi:ribosomal protein S18 acetylase RimI-like enzyme